MFVSVIGLSVWERFLFQIFSFSAFQHLPPSWPNEGQQVLKSQPFTLPLGAHLEERDALDARHLGHAHAHRLCHLFTAQAGKAAAFGRGRGDRQGASERGGRASGESERAGRENEWGGE